MTSKRLTKRIVDALRPGDLVWDEDVAGFGVRRQKASKTYVLKYRKGTTQAWYTIGRHGSPWTVEQARTEAKRLLGILATGGDPAAEKRATRAGKTVSDLCDRYLEEGCPGKKASTLATDKGRIERHIKPLLGKRMVRDVTTNDVLRFMQDVAKGKTAATVKTKPRGRARVTGGKGTASRTVGLLGGIFSFAVAEGARPDNPVRGVKRYPDKEGERFLSAQELAKLGEAMKKYDKAQPRAVAALRLLILTGARKSEILNLRWEDVDLDQGCLRLPDSKTGKKVIPLGAPALAVFEKIEGEDGNPYVFPGRVADKEDGKDKTAKPKPVKLKPKGKPTPYAALPRMWKDIRKKAGLEDVRLHDLRHSFASVGAGAGMGLLVVGKILGHRDPKTTQRYAHIADDPAKAAANAISASINAAMNKPVDAPDNVAEMKRRR